MCPLRSIRSKACTLGPSHAGCGPCLTVRRPSAVSVLDLEQSCACWRTSRPPTHARGSHKTDVSLYQRCQSHPGMARPNGRSNPCVMGLMICSCRTFVRRTRDGRTGFQPSGAAVVRIARANFAARNRRGGAYRDRTDDLLNANQALSQLS